MQPCTGILPGTSHTNVHAHMCIGHSTHKVYSSYAKLTAKLNTPSKQEAYSLSQESLNASLDEGQSQYGVNRGTITRVVPQTQVNESLEVLAVTRGDGWVCAPVSEGCGDG